MVIKSYFNRGQGIIGQWGERKSRKQRFENTKGIDIIITTVRP